MNPYSARQFLRGAGFRPSKKLGQNFLVDENVARKLIRLLEPRDSEVFLEIGAGVGALTLPLARKGVRVLAVEIDRRLAGILRAGLKEFPNVEVLEKDVLRLDVPRLAAGARACGGERPDRFQVLGNLPYSVTTQILLFLVRNRTHFGRALLTVQKEYAERLLAGTGTRQYGSITVLVRFYAEVENVMTVSPSCFFPRPEVSSSALRLTFREKPAVRVKDEAAFVNVVRASFSHRRKMVLNSIAERFDLEKNSAASLFRLAGVDGTKRAEQLELQELARIADVFYDEKLEPLPPSGRDDG
jgi:16S rRNA (adenine1518-N6/adenine1519-N6)-dimethyltransferase